MSSIVPPDDAVTAKVSSTVLFDQMHFMREMFGAQMVADAQKGLPDALRDELAVMIPGGWVSLDAARELKNAVAARARIDPLALQRTLCSRGVERTLNTFWRFFLRRLGDETLASRTPVLYSRTFNHGSLRLLSSRAGAAEFELSGWRIPDYDLLGLVTGVKTVLELAGRKDVQVTTTRKGAAVLLHATWPAKA